MAEPTFPEVAGAWFTRGNSDVRSAEALLALDPPETEVTAFHAQQAAEKYLKGFLAYHGDDPPRTHALSILLDLTLRYDSALDGLREAVRFLVPFAVDIRYPFIGDPLTVDEAQSAVRYATEVRAAIQSRVVLTPGDKL